MCGRGCIKWQGELPPVAVSVVGGVVGTVVGGLLSVVDYVGVLCRGN